MRNYEIFGRNSTGQHAPSLLFFKKSPEGTNCIPMFSDFFGNIPNNMFCTNAMYASFLQEILDTIGIYSPRDAITINVLERVPSEAERREFALIGFRNYIQLLFHRKWLEGISQLARVTLFALIGALLALLMYGLGVAMTPLQEFFVYSASSVLIWQFMGFWAFEFPEKRQELLRLKQIEKMEYTFTTWE